MYAVVGFGTVFGLGKTPDEARADAAVQVSDPADVAGMTCHVITPAQYDAVDKYGRTEWPIESHLDPEFYDWDSRYDYE